MRRNNFTCCGYEARSEDKHVASEWKMVNISSLVTLSPRLALLLSVPCRFLIDCCILYKYVMQCLRIRYEDLVALEEAHEERKTLGKPAIIH